MRSDWPYPVRVCESAVVIVGAESGTGRIVRHWLTRDQAREYAQRILRAADQAEYGVVPTIESGDKS